jgi:hypothetical protein
MISVAGTAALVYGSNSPHSRSLLKAACDAQGWKRCVNRPPSRHSALERAITDTAKPLLADGGAPLSVRALANDLSFEAVRVERGAQRNRVVHVYSAHVNAATDQVQVLDHDASLSHAELTMLTQAAYDNAMLNLSASQVRTVVLAAVRNLRGVSLGAPNLYYIPHDAVSQWHQWRDAAQLWRYHSTQIQVASDPATVEHIIHQLNEEVSAQAQEIIASVSSGVLEPKAAKALARRAKLIVDKIRSYEQALGQQLDWMRGPLEQAESTLAVSSLLAVSA